MGTEPKLPQPDPDPVFPQPGVPGTGRPDPDPVEPGPDVLDPEPGLDPLPA
jgi:hypothetical protein